MVHSKGAIWFIAEVQYRSNPKSNAPLISEVRNGG